MEKERMHKIIQVLKDIRYEADLKVSDETLFSEACSFTRGILQNENWKENNSWKNQATQKSSMKSEGTDTSVSKMEKTPNSSSDKSKISPMQDENDEEDKTFPTKSQIAYLNKWKISVPIGLTRMEAITMIGNHMNENKSRISER